MSQMRFFPFAAVPVNAITLFRFAQFARVADIGNGVRANGFG
jgi:hypothetical protein